MKKLLSFVVLFIALAFMAGCIQEDQTAKNTVEDVANNLFSNVDLNKVSSDLDFVENLNGVKITYVSSNQDVVSNTGKVTLGDNVEIVEINVTFQYDGYKLEKTYVLTVEKKTNKYKKFLLFYPFSDNMYAFPTHRRIHIIIKGMNALRL